MDIALEHANFKLGGTHWCISRLYQFSTFHNFVYITNIISDERKLHGIWECHGILSSVIECDIKRVWGFVTHNWKIFSTFTDCSCLYVYFSFNFRWILSYVRTLISEIIYMYKFLHYFCIWCIICYIMYEGSQ